MTLVSFAYQLLIMNLILITLGGQYTLQLINFYFILGVVIVKNQYFL